MEATPLYPKNDCPACARGEALRNHPYDGFELDADGKKLQLRPHAPSQAVCLKFIPPELVESFRKVRALPDVRVVTKEELFARLTRSEP
jgi:hypothetical protein